MFGLGLGWDSFGSTQPTYLHFVAVVVLTTNLL